MSLTNLWCLQKRNYAATGKQTIDNYSSIL